MTDKPYDGTQNRIVCAANRNRLTGEMLIGVRHCDLLMRDQRERLSDKGKNSEWEQGFVDRYGKYHDRQEAWKIAFEAGQIIRRCGGDEANGGTLYSENLY